mgnify:CR=1 FL=1
MKSVTNPACVRWTTWRKVKYLIDAFTAFSYLPIRVATLLGMVMALGGFLALSDRRYRLKKAVAATQATQGAAA